MKKLDFLQIYKTLVESWGWFVRGLKKYAKKSWQKLPRARREKYLRRARFAGFVYLFLAAVLAMCVYGFRMQNVVTYALSHLVPLPAAFVGAQPISYRAYMAEVGELTKSNNNKADISRQAMGELITRVHLDALARHYNLVVAGEEVDAEMDLYLDYFGDQKRAMDETGWSKRRLKIEAKQSLLKRKLEAKVAGDPVLLEQNREKAESILAEALSEKDLKALAMQYPGRIEPVNAEDPTIVEAAKLPEPVLQAALKRKDGEIVPTVTEFEGSFYVVQRVRLEQDRLLVRAIEVTIPTLGQSMGQQYLKAPPLVLLFQTR